MQLLLWLENSSLGDWIRTSSWAYPWVNAFHSVGMSILVGIVFMIAVRILGFGRFPIAPLGNFLKIARIAFVLNLITGFVLFAGDAQHFFTSPTFIVKMIFVVLGGITAIKLTGMAFRGGSDWSGSDEAPQPVKVMAAVSLACWFTAILAGRMTAYLP